LSTPSIAVQDAAALHSSAHGPVTKPPFLRSLYFRVLVGLVAGIVTGYFFPHFAVQLSPFADGFIKLIRMLVAPIIFFTVVLGIASFSDMRRLGRIGLKAIIYFEAVTTLALLIGMAVANFFVPGSGMNVDPRTLDTHSIAQYTTQGAHLSAVDFVLNVIPDSFVGAFVHGEILQVLLLAVLCGVAIAHLCQRAAGASGPESQANPLLLLAERLSTLFFKLVAFVMELSPLAAFGAMAFTIGRYGVKTLLSLAGLLGCVYLTSIAFVFVVLGAICALNRVSLWKLLVYLREELLIVLATSSSESALPLLIAKMETLGCSKTVTGLVIPAGYSFNLDGTSIYLTVAALFIAQATNVHLSFAAQVFVLLMLMLNSKGAAAVTGGGFITLAATLSAIGTIPVAGITLIVGIDRFMSEMRSLTNLVGNAVATIVIARWEGQFDHAQAQAMLNPTTRHAALPD
jgi:aerobic C4-dicarboxylate transport protein